MSHKKVIAVLGCDTFQIGWIEFLKENSYSVIVISNRLNDPGIQMADIHLPISYIELDRLQPLFYEYSVNQVVTSSSEAAWKIQAYLQKKMGWISSYNDELIKLFNDKYQLSKSLKVALKDNLPQLKLIENNNSFLDWSVKHLAQSSLIIKPINGSGSRGITKISTEIGLKNFIIKNRTEKFIASPYIHGQEYGGDFIYNGKHFFYYPTLKKVNKYFVPIGHLMLKENGHIKSINNLIKQLIDNLNLPIGIYNIDVIVSTEKAYLIDFSPRIGGNAIPEILLKATGVNEYDFLLAYLLTGKIKNFKISWNYPVGVFILNSDREGVIRKITENIDRQLFFNKIIKIFWKKKIGDIIESFIEGSKHLGYIIFKADTDQELKSTFDQIQEFKWFELE